MLIKKIRVSTMQNLIFKGEKEIECLGLYCTSKDIGLIYKEQDTLYYCVNIKSEVNEITANTYKMCLANFIKNYPNIPLVCLDKFYTEKTLLTHKIDFKLDLAYDLKTIIKLSANILDLPISTPMFDRGYIFKKYYNSKFRNSVLDNLVGLILVSAKFLKVIAEKEMQEVLRKENIVENTLIRLRTGEIDIDKEYVELMFTRLTRSITAVRKELKDKLLNINLGSKSDMLSFINSEFGLSLTEIDSIDRELDRLTRVHNAEHKLLARKVYFLRRAEYLYRKYVSGLLKKVIDNKKEKLELNVSQNMYGLIKSNIAEIEEVVLKNLDGYNVVNSKKIIKQNPNTVVVKYEYEELDLRVIADLAVRMLPKEERPQLLIDTYVNDKSSAKEVVKKYVLGFVSDKEEEFIDYTVDKVVTSCSWGASAFGVYRDKVILDKIGAENIIKIRKGFYELFGEINGLQKFVQSQAEYYGFVQTEFGKKFYLPAEYIKRFNEIPKIYLSSICSDIIKQKLLAVDIALKGKKSRIIGVNEYAIYVEIDKSENVGLELNKKLRNIHYLKTIPTKLKVTKDESVYKLNYKEQAI